MNTLARIGEKLPMSTAFLLIFIMIECDINIVIRCILCFLAIFCFITRYEYLYYVEKILEGEQQYEQR